MTTPLDQAHAAMEAAPDDDNARLAFWGQMLRGALHILLDAEPEGDNIVPRLFPLDEGPFVLAFDTEERLADFAAGPAPYASIPGAKLAEMLAGQKVGIALNLGGAPSQMLLPNDAVAWLAEHATTAPKASEARITEVGPPGDLPEARLQALDAALARAAGLAATAYLAEATYDDGSTGHLVAMIDPAPGAEPALVQAVQSVVTFTAGDPAPFDVVFLSASAPMAARIARWGLRFDLEAPASDAPTAPKGPPRLR